MRVRGLARTFVAGAALLIIVVGVPTVLVMIAGWPLPTGLPDLDDLRRRLQQGDIPAEAVVNALAVVAWIVWLQVVWALGWELVVNQPRIAQRRPPSAAPLVPRPLTTGVGRLVAMLFSVSIVVTTPPAPVVAMPSSTDAVTLELDATEEETPSEVVENAPASETCWMVQPEDSLWKIAEQALGDGGRGVEILRLNPMLQSARDVRAGQQLRLPADAQVPAERQPHGPPAVEGGEPSAPWLPETTAVIQPGDTLWDLSSARLEQAHGMPPTDRAIVEYLEFVIAANPETIEDPNLIYPGEHFTMPAIGTPPDPIPDKKDLLEQDTAQVSPTGHPPVDLDADATGDDVSDPSVGDEADVSPDRAAVASVAPAPTGAAAPSRNGSRPTTASATSKPPTAQPSSDESSADEVNGSPSWPFVLGGSTALASGLVLLLRRRQRIARARGVGSTVGSTAGKPIAHEMVRASDIPLLDWARHELTDVFADPSSQAVDGVPVAVEIGEQSGIELLWSDPQLTAPRPWEASDDGWTWRATYDPDIDVPASGATPMPGLVTVGSRNGRQLLLNLEAFGVLHIDGDESTLELCRSMVAELSVDEILADTYVHIVDAAIEPPLDTSRCLDRTIDESLERAGHVVAQHEALVAEAGVRTSFALRRGDEAEGRELTVFVTAGTGNAERIHEVVKPHRGVAALVLSAGVAEDDAVIAVSGDQAVLRPLGLRFNPARLTEAAAEEVEEFLDSVVPTDQGEVEPTEDDGESDRLDECESPEQIELDLMGDDELGPTADEPSPPEVLVSILGPVEVPGYPELGRMDVNVLAFLACNGGEATTDQLMDAVWNGRLIENASIWNRISKVRAILGPHVPARKRGVQHVVIERSVQTDLDYFEDLVRYADNGSSDEATESLSRAMDLIRGQPFDSSGYDWAHRFQFHARACDTIESAAIKLVELALENGDVDLARKACATGLRALPGNESIYRCRMQAEASIGNSYGVQEAFKELTAALAEQMDDIDGIEPSARTVHLRDELLGVGST